MSGFPQGLAGGKIPKHGGQSNVRNDIMLIFYNIWWKHIYQILYLTLVYLFLRAKLVLLKGEYYD